MPFKQAVVRSLYFVLAPGRLYVKTQCILHSGNSGVEYVSSYNWFFEYTVRYLRCSPQNCSESRFATALHKRNVGAVASNGVLGIIEAWRVRAVDVLARVPVVGHPAVILLFFDLLAELGPMAEY